MCGISFVINSNSRLAPRRPIKYRDLFEDMLVAGAVRGTDGTGAFQVDHKGDVFFAKSAMASGTAVREDQSLRNIIKVADDSPITVGHVRAATQGSVNENNSHPFIGYKDDAKSNYLIGVHNGTLYGWEYEDTDNEHDVDSAWAYSHLAKKGTEAFKDFYGAYAMVWFDSERPGKVFFTRNKERPLHVARSADGHSIIGSSESGMLQWLAHRNDITIGEVYSIEPGAIYSIDTDDTVLSIQWEEDTPEYVSSSVNYGTGYDYARYYRDRNTNTLTVPQQQPSPPGLPAPIMATIEWESSKDKTIREVKAALRAARYTLVTPAMVDNTEDEDTPFEMGPTEVRVRAKADWYSVADASEEEQKKAFSVGAFGQVISFEGATYDTFNNSIVGEIAMPSTFKGALAYLPAAEPYEFNYYEDRRVPLVVIGARTFGDQLEYIVTPLNEKGEEALAA